MPVRHRRKPGTAAELEHLVSIACRNEAKDPHPQHREWPGIADGVLQDHRPNSMLPNEPVRPPQRRGSAQKRRNQAPRGEAVKNGGWNPTIKYSTGRLVARASAIQRA